MSTTKNRSRLGKGLSALLNAPVQVATSSPDRESVRPSSAAMPEPEKSPQSDGQSPMRAVPVSKLKPNRLQPRKSFDQPGLERLAESIRTTGMMQPIVVRPSGASWEIVAGERRWRAAQLANLDSVPVIVSDVDDRAAAEWALIENLQREDLNPIDRAVAFRGLADRYGLTHAEIAERVGLERSTVANLVRLMDLEPEIQEFVRDGVLSTGHAKALLASAPGAARIKLAGAARAGDWSVRYLEEQIKRAQEASASSKPGAADSVGKSRVAGREELQRQLGEHLGTKVQIKTNAAGNKGSLVISFFGVDHFDSLMERFGFELRS